MLESGGLATAHMVANPLSNFPECKHLMHGEKVGFGIATQLCLDDEYDVDEKYAIFDFQIDPMMLNPWTDPCASESEALRYALDAGSIYGTPARVRADLMATSPR